MDGVGPPVGAPCAQGVTGEALLGSTALPNVATNNPDDNHSVAEFTERPHFVLRASGGMLSSGEAEGGDEDLDWV
jgi:hypothetical protein